VVAATLPINKQHDHPSISATADTGKTQMWKRSLGILISYRNSAGYHNECHRGWRPAGERLPQHQVWEQISVCLSHTAWTTSPLVGRSLGLHELSLLLLQMSIIMVALSHYCCRTTLQCHVSQNACMGEPPFALHSPCKDAVTI